ncbi:MAG TPA: diguanylate cyclase, partial [Anaerolineales bacterium]|nr:diguanylate cyclase [Anaerolineales bacterium]
QVFKAAHEGIVITDMAGVIVDVNPAFFDITGYRREESIGQNPRILSSGKHSPEFFSEMWNTLVDQGFWKGELWNRKKGGELYAELLTISAIVSEDGKTQNYIGLFSDITKSKEQQKSLELMAHYDELTGLPNRSLFADRYKQAIAHSKRTETLLAVCFLDLDEFKPVNDNYGHLVGDQLLIEVAERIKSQLRAEDTVSRMGGDEFALLLGDISTINTPPEERLPIVTHVGPYNPRLVRRAVLRELERGGQIFFVHNRVQTIEGMRAHLERLVPEARIGVAHGQMPETALAARMREFSAGMIDILLSTTIIESGLDIPNANTLIVDRADTFGLAQLYQLRGRVGRGAQRAYAYFFKHARRKPTAEAAERLETLAENTQLGAGFNIAMRDLEIRGAGDILGARQHGHVAAVGFHLYTRLLASAIRRLQETRGEALQGSALLTNIHRPMVSVDLPLDTHLPPEYIPDQETRLGLYRRIADIITLDDLDALAEEFVDRFGPLPASVGNLLFQVRVKI